MCASWRKGTQIGQHMDPQAEKGLVCLKKEVRDGEWQVETDQTREGGWGTGLLQGAAGDADLLDS